MTHTHQRPRRSFSTFGDKLNLTLIKSQIKWIQTVRPTKISMAESKPDLTNPSSEEKDVKAPNVIERAKEEIEAIFHSGKSPRHHKETHGTSDDIDEDTPVDEVKGPNVFERVKEEIEALVGSIHPKKDRSDKSSS